VVFVLAGNLPALAVAELAELEALVLGVLTAVAGRDAEVDGYSHE
jgi:hypothetical protein